MRMRALSLPTLNTNFLKRPTSDAATAAVDTLWKPPAAGGLKRSLSSVSAQRIRAWGNTGLSLARHGSFSSKRPQTVALEDVGLAPSPPWNGTRYVTVIGAAPKLQPLTHQRSKTVPNCSLTDAFAPQAQLWRTVATTFPPALHVAFGFTPQQAPVKPATPVATPVPPRSSMKNPSAPPKPAKRVYFMLPAEAPDAPFKPTASETQKLLFALNRASSPMEVLNVFHSYTRRKRWENIDDAIAGLTAHMARLPKSMRSSEVGAMKHAVFKTLLVDLDWNRHMGEIDEDPKNLVHEAFEDTWMSIRYGVFGRTASA